MTGRDHYSEGATTTELLAVTDRLGEHQCAHVAMKATGVHWKPVWHLLETEVELVLANAARICKVPGRKTHVKDAMWIADRVGCGSGKSAGADPTARPPADDDARVL